VKRSAEVLRLAANKQLQQTVMDKVPMRRRHHAAAELRR
jgi:hypothetical protein